MELKLIYINPEGFRVKTCQQESNSIHSQLIRNIDFWQIPVGKLFIFLVGKPEGKRPLGRPRRRWEDNIKMDLQEVGGGYGDWMELVQDRDRWRAVVSKVRNLRVPKMQ